MTTFPEFFETVTGKEPYGYQCCLAASPCQSRLIQIPTGLGKTAAVVLAWLWNRVRKEEGRRNTEEVWPRRLVYCVPMRTLVEQTATEVRGWVGKLVAEGLIPLKHEEGRPRVVILMGGEVLEGEEREWDLYPEHNAILIGTQDMLLSRALNRGYGMSRYRWPMHFGLLNNDCLWVMDETQLMGPGLSTACQLEAFRNSLSQGLGSFSEAGSVTWYMSATSNLDHLQTRDWRGVSRHEKFILGLTNDEKIATIGEIHKRCQAVKRLEPRQSTNFGDGTAALLVEELVAKHREMLTAIDGDPSLPARTLIICNTVDRAAHVHALIEEQKPDNSDLLLLHSRFRPPERRAKMERLKAESLTAFPMGQIVVATQVIEAGVDISSGILCSEVAPLASLVQRLGRLNRAGEFNESSWKPLAIVVGVGEQAETGNAEAKKTVRKDNERRCLPYELAVCGEDAVWKPLAKLEGDASPASLETIQSDVAKSIPRCPYSLQRHELLDFFDTDSNLSLGFTDVSPFVRGLDEDTDIQVCWRESWPQEDDSDGIGKPGFSPDYQRDELCSVPISKALKAREVLNHGWTWRGKKAGWISVRDAGLSPGMTILLPLSAGGYDEHAGWTGDKDDNKHSSAYEPRQWPSDEDQLSSLANGWRTIAHHTNEVGEELATLIQHLLIEEQNERSALSIAVPWHDVGKNHPGWQEAVQRALDKAGILDKSDFKPFAKFSLSESPKVRNEDGSPKFTGKQLYAVLKTISRYFSPDATHEVASALAFRQAEQKRLGSDRDTNILSLLTEYVIMSHHGRVRKVLRDEIPRFPESREDTETVRGIAHGSPLPSVAIGDQSLGCDALSTDCRKMGRSAADGHESYTRGVLRLLEHYGPFRLAYLEALFRAADMRASIRASQTP